MAKQCLIIKQREGRFKFKVRRYNRCQRCGRSRAYCRRFALCRLCLRELANRGMLIRLTEADELADPLSYMYEHETTDRPSNPLQLFLSVFGRPRRTPAGTTGQMERAVEDKSLAADQGLSEEPEGEQAGV